MKERREHSMKYETPFHVESGVILDASGRTVRLFGVNYYAPFKYFSYSCGLFRFSLASWKKITDPSGKKEFEKVDDCSARLLPGSYRIFL